MSTVTHEQWLADQTEKAYDNTSTRQIELLESDLVHATVTAYRLQHDRTLTRYEWTQECVKAKAAQDKATAALLDAGWEE